MLGFLSMAAVGVAVVKAVDEAVQIVRLSAPYRERILTAARRYGVSPHVLVGIIKTESAFNPNAVGSSGEVGLGQFKPIAAKDVGVDFNLLHGNPDLQIDSAAALLALNAKRANGNILTSIRAYNVGIGAATKDAGLGTDYAFKVLRVAFLDWIYGSVLAGPKA